MKHRRTSRVKAVASLAVAGLLALATSTTITTTGAALAAPPAQDSQGRQGLFGNVTARSDNSLTIQTRQDNEIDLAIDAATRFQVQGQSNAGIEDIPIGSRVAVLAAGEAGPLVALRVMPVPSQPTREHRVLTVVETSGKTIIAEDSQGNRVEVGLDSGLDSDARGQLVTFIGERSQQSNRFKASAEVKIGEVVERMEAQARQLELEARAETRAQVRAEKERQLARLEARLEANMQRHLDLFTEVITRAPEQARASLEAALDLTVRGYVTALESLGESRTGVEARLHLRGAEGSVGDVDVENQRVTIMSRGNARLGLDVDDQTEIHIGGQAGTLADISAGDWVSVRYNSQTMTATAIRVQVNTTVSGVITSVGETGEGLVLELPSGSTLNLDLDSSASIKVNGQPAAAADLKPNATARVTYDARTGKVLEVRADGTARIEGTVRSADTRNGTVTIVGGDGQEITLRVADDTRLSVQGLLFGLLGLNSGMKVEARYDLNTGVAHELKASGGGRVEAEVQAQARATGTVAGVNAASGDVEIDLNAGGTLVVTATGDTRVEIDGQASALAGLRAGDRVTVKYDTRNRVAAEIEATATAPASVSGTLQAVDPLNNTVTIVTEDGRELTLSLAASATLMLDGAASSAVQLATRTGSQVSARYNPAVMVATSITVESQSRTGTGSETGTEAESSAAVSASGTLQAVDPLNNTVSIVTEGGAELALSITSQSRVMVDGAATGATSLLARVGSSVTVQYDAETMAVLALSVQR